MSEITNLEELKLHIAKRYLFTEQKYPIIGTFNSKEERIFIVKQCLSHIYQKMYTFLIEAEKMLYEVEPEVDYTFVQSSAEIMMNILKIADLMNTSLELHNKVWHHKEEYREILKYLGKISAECEKFDRKNIYSAKVFEEPVQQLWTEFIKIINFENQVSYKEMYKVISILL